MIETEYITTDAKDFEGGFIFQTFTPRRSIELGQIKIADVNYTYQEPSPFSETLPGAGGLMDLYQRLFGKG